MIVHVRMSGKIHQYRPVGAKFCELIKRFLFSWLYFLRVCFHLQNVKLQTEIL